MTFLLPPGIKGLKHKRIVGFDTVTTQFFIFPKIFFPKNFYSPFLSGGGGACHYYWVANIIILPEILLGDSYIYQSYIL